MKHWNVNDNSDSLFGKRANNFKLFIVILITYTAGTIISTIKLKTFCIENIFILFFIAATFYNQGWFPLTQNLVWQ